jgi:hypothetical protein
MLVKLFSRLLKWDWFFEVVDGCVESHAKERRLRLEDLMKSVISQDPIEEELEREEAAEEPPMVKIMRQIVPKEPHAVLHYQNREEKVVPSTSDILLTAYLTKHLTV